MLRAMYGRIQVAYIHLPVVEVVGGWPQAIVFSHLAFWYERYERPVYKSARELGEELHMGERTVERAIAQLRSLGVLMATVKKAGGAPTNHYSVDYERLADLLAEADSAKVAESDSAKVAESLTEGTNRRESKPSSETSSDAFQKPETSSARQAGDAIPSPNGPKAHPPSSAAPPSQLTELLEIWNEHRGKLPALRSLNAKRERLLKRLVRESEAAKLDPREVVKAAALEVANDPHYLQNRYTLENVIQSQSNRLGKLIDALLEAPPGEELVVGQLYVWPRDPSRPWAGELLGAFTGEVIEVRGRTFAVMDLDGTQVRAPVDELEPRK